MDSSPRLYPRSVTQDESHEEIRVVFTEGDTPSL